MARSRSARGGGSSTPAGSGPDVVASGGGQAAIYTTACEIVAQFVLTYGNEAHTLKPDGTLSRDGPQFGEMRGIKGTTEIPGHDGC